MSDHDVLDALAAANPVPVESLAGLARSRGDALREQIMRQPRGVPRAVPRRLVLAGAGLTAAGAAAVAVVAWPKGARPAFAATPPMLTYRPDGRPAADVLEGLARRAERQPAPGTGRFDYVQMQSYYLDTAASRDGGASALRAVREERWLAPDGSGRAVDIPGAILVLHGDNGETFTAVTFRDDTRQVQRYGPGELSGVADLASMPADPRRLAGRLAADRTTFAWSDNAPTAPDWYRRVAVVTGIAKQQAVPPALWAAMVRVLATTPGLTSRGTVRDRYGRPAVAISFDSEHDGGRPSRTVLLFSPDTGAYLGEEHILTTKRGDGPYDAYLKVKIPAVTEYRAVMAVRRVATDGA